MKSRTLMCVTAITLFAVALPLELAAQKPRYRLVDIPTLGGDKAYSAGNGPGTAQFLNNAGTVVGSSDTTILDPNAPNCGNFDCLVSHAFQWQDGVLTDLGTLKGVGSDLFSGVNASNARGWIAGFSQNGEIDPVSGFPAVHAVLWKNSEISDLGTLGTGVQSSAGYVDNGGAVVGISTVDTSFDPFASSPFGPYSSPTHAFTWKNGVMRDLRTLGGPDSFITGFCDDERPELVAGESYTNSTKNLTTGFPTLHAFLWKNGTMQDIPTLGGTFAYAQCANNRGQVIGQSSLTGDPGCDGSNPLNSCNQHAFLWERGSLKDLGTLGGTFSIPIWLNNAAEAVGGATTINDESFHATLWKDGRITDLGTLEGDCFSQAFAINSKGQIVGESFNCDTNTLRAVLWDKGAIIELDGAIPANSSLQLRETFNINDQGDSVGEGFPVGCNDVNVCGHIFLLVPCDAGVKPCEGNDGRSVRPRSTAMATRATTSTQRREMTKAFVARLRSRLAQRYHISGLGVPRN
jgi:probable HAF family extracellular repeat protein